MSYEDEGTAFINWEKWEVAIISKGPLKGTTSTPSRLAFQLKKDGSFKTFDF